MKGKQRYHDYGQDQEIVLLRDDRTPVTHTARPPFRWICSLEVEFAEPVLYSLATLEHPGQDWKDLQASRKGCGSGLLIGPQQLLTSAHVLAGLKVVRDRAGGTPRFKLVKAKKVRVIPGRNDETAAGPKRPYGTWDMEKVHINPAFQRAMEVPVKVLTKKRIRNALATDFGLIDIRLKAQPPICPGQLAGWWGEQPQYALQTVSSPLRSQLARASIHIGGYPGEKGKRPCSQPWHSTDAVADVNPGFDGQALDLLLYRADTSAGMSGSPVWLQHQDGRFSLVAVHSSFLPDPATHYGRVNAGALVSSAMIRQLDRWRKSYLQVQFSNHSAI